jgi:hypothetical protein
VTVAVGDFGPLVINTDIDDTLIAMFRTWIQTYLTAVSSERGLPVALKAPRPASYFRVLTPDALGDAASFPVIAVTASGTNGAIDRNNDGSYTATFRTAVSALVRGQDADSTRHTASIYEGSVRRCIVQQAPGFGPIVCVDPISYNVQPVPGLSRDGRYVAAGLGVYDCSVDQAMQNVGGPTVPDLDYVDGATVTEVEIDLATASTSGPFSEENPIVQIPEE